MLLVVNAVIHFMVINKGGNCTPHITNIARARLTFEVLIFAGKLFAFRLRLAFHLHRAPQKNVVFLMNVSNRTRFSPDEVSL